MACIHHNPADVLEFFNDAFLFNNKNFIRSYTAVNKLTDYQLMIFDDNRLPIIVLFVETPRKFITAVINLRGVSTNKTIICFITMQTYKELNRLPISIY
jgi:hypothetical protein